MTDTNSTTNAASDATASAKSGEATSINGSASGAPAQPSNPENAVSKVQAAASHSPATVAQDLYDRVHADFQAVTAKLNEKTDELERLKQDYQSAIAAFHAIQLDRDEIKAYASNLSEQLAEAKTKLEAAGASATTALKATYASAEEEKTALEAEITNIKARVHAGVDEAKGLAERLADLVPVNHPGRALSTALSHLKAKVVELL